VGLTIAGAWSFGCASIIGADDYKVAGGAGGAGTDSTTGAAGDATVATTTSGTTTTTGGTTTTTGAGGTGGGSECSGPTPAGQRMCGAGKTCNTDSCGPPLTFACFTAGSVTEGGECTSKTDCAVGLTCIHYSTIYACRTLCTVDTDCAPGYRCGETFTCGNNTATAGKYCAKPCSDVVTAAGSQVCAAGFRCNFGCDAATQSPLPPSCDFEAGAGRSGSCSSDDDCAAGFYCLTSQIDPTQTVCTQACRNATDCTTGTCTGTIYCGNTATTYHYCK
jgi:hypothetical protein